MDNYQCAHTSLHANRLNSSARHRGARLRSTSLVKNYFKRTELALLVCAALVSPCLCSAEVPLGFALETPNLPNNTELSNFFEGSLTSYGPYRFRYITVPSGIDPKETDFNKPNWKFTPERVGYVAVFASDDRHYNYKELSKPQDFVIKKDFPEEAFGSKQYLSLIGAYWGSTFDEKNPTKETPSSSQDNFNYALQVFDGRQLNVTLEPGVTFYSSDIYAANQDKVKNTNYQTFTDKFVFTVPITQDFLEKNGPKDSQDTWFKLFSTVQNNQLTLSLSEDSVLHFQRIVGGKTRTWRETGGANNRKPWTYAYNNSVEINGGTLIGKSTYDLDKDKPEVPGGISDIDFKFYFRSSIIGGSGFIANNNTVSVTNAVIDNISKKYGIVGGRAYDGTHLAKNTLYGCSADGNVIYIADSKIGMDTELSGSGINIYGGLSYGAATNNSTILENSTFNGNVYGAAAALGSVLDKHEYGTDNEGKNVNQAVSGNHFYTYYNNTDNKLIQDSLNNAQILYLFNKAENQYTISSENKATNKHLDFKDSNAAFDSYWVGLSDENTVSLNRVNLTPGSSVYASAGIFVPVDKESAIFNNAKVVNLRRGTAFIGDKNEVSSIYAKNVIFGRYYTQDLDGKHVFKDDKAVRLGENISSSYVINTSGFHSSLSQRSEVQSSVTNGMHNFWSNVTAVLGNTMNGNGQELTVNNHVYEQGQIKERNFSLLALDNNDATSDHYFANSAKLYLAVSQGSPSSAPIAINWSRIAEYRLSFASGGQFLPEGGNLLINGNNLPNFDKAFSPFPTVSVLIGGDTHTGAVDTITSVANIDQDFINKIRNSSFEAGIAVKQTDSNAPDGARTAANAKFEISQYLDFGDITQVKNGEVIKTPIYDPKNPTMPKDEEFAKEGDWVSYVKQTNDSSWEGGVSIRYKLKELELADSNFQLILYGLDLNDTAGNVVSADGYTLDAKLSQATGVDGGIVVYENQKVIIRTQYDSTTVGIYEGFKKGDEINHKNEYSGVTTVQKGSILEVIGDNALGTVDVHTNALYLHDNSQFKLSGYNQTIGSLNQYAASLTLNSEKPEQLGRLDILQTPKRGSYIRGTITGQSGSNISVANGTTTITSPNGTGYVGNFNVLGGTTTENSQPTSGGNPILFTTIYLASPRALDKATINAADDTSLVFDNGGTDGNHVTVDIEDGVRNYHAGTINAGAGYLFVSNPNIQVQNNGIVPHHLHVNSMNLNNTNLVFSTLFEKDGNGLVDNSHTDRIYVDGAASGTGNVLINALPGSEMGYTKANGGILLVSAPNADQNFKLSKGQVYIIQENRLSRAADNNSDIKYELKSKNDLNGNFEDGANKYWYLVSSVDGQSPDDNDHPTPSDPNKPVVEPIQPGDTTPSKDLDGSFTPGGTRPGHHETQVRPQLAAFATNVLAWDKLNMRLHDRIGEAYFLDPETHEIKKAAGWARFQGTHGHAKVDRSARTTGNYMTTQVGTDLLRTDLNEDWRLIGGVFFGSVYGKAHTNSLLKARSKVVGFGGGAYVTLFSGNSPDDGFYTDLWVSYNHFKNEVSGDEPSVKYHSKGTNYSGEIGYTIHAATTRNSSSQDKVEWYIQPQFQATLQGVKADNFTDWTGNRIKQDGKYNVQLRTGVRVYGRQSAQGNVFVETNWIHNTKKKGVISGAETYYVDGTRNAGEGRIGWEGNITKNLLGSVTGSVRAGNKGYNEVSGNISIKYMF